MRLERHCGWRSGLILALAFVATACTGGPPAELAQGLVVGTHTDPATGAIDSFYLRETDGTTLEFEVGTLQLDQGSFNAAHLVVHAITEAPVIVEYHEENGRHVVFRMTDAPKTP